MNDYHSLVTPIETELKIKDSRFIAFLSAAESRQEAEARITERSRQFRDATHNCYAFRIGFDDQLIAKSSDAGEPAGTAGRPILQALERRQLTNVVAIVTRYFGGAKLGTGGLVRAYGRAASAAIDLAAWAPVFPKHALRLRYSYPQRPAVQKILHLLAAESIREDFGVEIEHVVEIRAERSDETQRLLRDACAGRVNIEIIKER